LHCGEIPGSIATGQASEKSRNPRSTKIRWKEDLVRKRKPPDTCGGVFERVREKEDGREEGARGIEET